VPKGQNVTKWPLIGSHPGDSRLPFVSRREAARSQGENLWPPRKSLTNPRDEEIQTFDTPGRSSAYAIWGIPVKHRYTAPMDWDTVACVVFVGYIQIVRGDFAQNGK